MDGLDTPLEVDTKIANALLGLATKAFVAAQLAGRDASISALQGAKACACGAGMHSTADHSIPQPNHPLTTVARAWLHWLDAARLHLEAPLSAALANGADTLSITADRYSVAAADAALAAAAAQDAETTGAISAALLAYYTLAQVDALLADYRTGTAQDAETTSAISAALLAYYTSAQAGALLAESAQDTQTQIAGALLAYRTGPDQDVFTTNQITLALVAYRSAADHGNGLGRRSCPAQLSRRWTFC